ncbi:hypothetical protein P879_01716 [Paragonimus westermani]|uniref:HMG box domain-containing protein n=1 Tax=Paragonimus westermani TaxID=34504 RepID=A0A8T0DQ17_9TREM|nr:hypothetical protein P879_01716 [Paragonimus westermani]
MPKNKKKRPPGPYALFVRSRKNLYTGSLAAFAKKCATEWRKLSEQQREIFRRKADSLKKQAGRATLNVPYLDFVNTTYECLRRNHPSWTAKRVREQLMKNYRKKKCKCSK